MSSLDRTIAKLAVEQHGVVSRAQLLSLGATSDAIDGRVRRGQMHSVHRGVYAVGHTGLSLHGRMHAAVLACGSGAVLSHRSAAWLLGLVSKPAGAIEITKARGWRAPAGLWVYRSALPKDELTQVEGMPVTSVSRTLFDLAVVVTRRRLELAINEAEVRGLTASLSLADLVARYPRRAGTGVVRRLLRDEARLMGVVRSELEQRFVELLDHYGLPRPRLNFRVPVGDVVLELDCVWPDLRVAVELDGGAAHRTSMAFERDRRRDRLLIAAGWRVIRLTWRQIHEESDAVVADLRQVLGLSGSEAHRRAA